MGISADSVSRQKEFSDKNDLDYPLLSDDDKSIAKMFGVKRFGPIPSKRATFVIGTDRKILGVTRSEMGFESHADESLQTLRSAAA